MLTLLKFEEKIKFGSNSLLPNKDKLPMLATYLSARVKGPAQALRAMRGKNRGFLGTSLGAEKSGRGGGSLHSAPEQIK